VAVVTLPERPQRSLSPRGQVHRLADPGAQIAQQTIVHAVDHPVKCEQLSAPPGVAHAGQSADVTHLFDHVDLAQPVRTLAFVGQRIEAA